MPRFFYSLLFFLAQPLVWLRLLWRARQQVQYMQHLNERYALYRQSFAACQKNASAPQKLLWLHAVSVGETRAAEPLIKALLDAYPQHALLLTHMTPTGRATGAEIIEKLSTNAPNRLFQAYLPYDLPGACQRFFANFQPQIGLFMETEVWPNFIAIAQQQNIPVLLINARLSERSQRAYQRILPLIRPAFAGFSAVAAQTKADAARLAQLGAQPISIMGNLKFDVSPDPEKLKLGQSWRQNFVTHPARYPARAVWLAASTREGEEELILDAFVQLNHQSLLLLLVPRHPQRFNEVAALIKARGLSFQRRSSGGFPTPETQVWLGDSMGEMPAYFAAADIALIGGSLLPFGGQNLIEAAACACPVLVGPHTHNFAQATIDALACGAAQRVLNATAAAQIVAQLINQQDQPNQPNTANSELAAMRCAAQQFSQAHRGATQHTLALIKKYARPTTNLPE